MQEAKEFLICVLATPALKDFFQRSFPDSESIHWRNRLLPSGREECRNRWLPQITGAEFPTSARGNFQRIFSVLENLRGMFLESEIPVPLGPRNLDQLFASAKLSAGEIRTKKVKKIKRIGINSEIVKYGFISSTRIITSRISKNKGFNLVNSRILSVFFEALGAKLGRLIELGNRMRYAFSRNKHEEYLGRKEFGWQVGE